FRRVLFRSLKSDFSIFYEASLFYFCSMKKILLIVPFLVFLISLGSSAQSIQIKGKVIDETKAPVSDLTVYLSKAKDSTLIQYATTDVAGLFSIDLKAVEEPSFLTFSLLDFIDKVETFDKITETKDLGT